MSFFPSGGKLEVIFYQDAVNISNFVGATQKLHKLVGIYMLVGNLPIHMHSQIKKINLVAYCKDKDFEAERVIGHIRKDFSRLEEEGINVHGKVFYGSIVLASGDNLGQHFLAGMVENFSKSLYFCRFCVISRNEWLKDILEKKVRFYDIRTVESYDRCVATLERTKSFHCKGVKKNSELNKLKHFHVCSPGLACCTAHDLYMGVVKYDLPLHINHLIEIEGWFTYDELNGRIRKFKLGDSNKLVEFPLTGSKLSRTAAEVRNLLKYLPLVIIDKICDSVVWQNVLLLSHISDFVCAPCVDSSFLPLLQELTNLYLEQRMRLFPKTSLRPKHHYMSHLSFLTNAFGPLVHVWTMNIEIKHTVAKRIVRSGRNFQNVTFSVSSKHQLLQASNFASIPKGVIVMGREVEFCLSSYSEVIQSAVSQTPVDAVFDCGSAVSYTHLTLPTNREV